MRLTLLASLVLTSSLVACATAPDDATGSSDSSDQLDAPVGKEDAASKPGGAYTNATPHYGELTTLSLDADHSFTLTMIGACAGGGTCAPITESGRFLLTHSTNSSRRYIRLYADDNSDLGRYQWKIAKGALELELDGDDHWFTMAAGATCESAGGTCAPLVPDACEFGSIGDAREYSCGGGLGVECCLPLQETGCSADADCTGLVPQFCRQCDDGTQACAHWSCADHACAIVSCPQ